MYASDSILIFLGSFLLGSIPVGVLLAKLFRMADPRTIGSGNIGATNMLRTGNKKVALLTLLFDALKGVLPVLFVQHLMAGPDLQALAMLGALVGHCYTPWLKFKGGKGVATALGGAWALHWIIGLAFCGAWLATFLMTRYVSLSSILALLAMAFATGAVLGQPAGIIVMVAAGIVIWRHRGNIARIQAGIEPKMGKKRDA